MSGPKSDGGAWINKEKIPNDQKTERWPDLKGYITVTGEQLTDLVYMIKNGMEPKLQIGVWHRNAAGGGAYYIHIGTETYVPQNQQQQHQGYPPQQQAPQQAQGYQQGPPQGYQQASPQGPPQGYQPQQAQTQQQGGFRDTSAPPTSGDFDDLDVPF